MDRLVKRYENRKMYDTRDGGYVSLEDIKEAVLRGETIKVIDNNSEEDITVHTLTQIVLEESKSGRNPFSSDLLHNIIRWGNSMLDEGLEQVKHQLDDLLPASLQHFISKRTSTPNELQELKQRVEQLEKTLQRLEDLR